MIYRELPLANIFLFFENSRAVIRAHVVMQDSLETVLVPRKRGIGSARFATLIATMPLSWNNYCTSTHSSTGRIQKESELACIKTLVRD